MPKLSVTTAQQSHLMFLAAQTRSFDMGQSVMLACESCAHSVTPSPILTMDHERPFCLTLFGVTKGQQRTTEP